MRDSTVPARPDGADRLPPLLRPLRSRPFAALWTGQAVSSLGDAVYQLILPWTMFALTGSARDVGLLMAAESLPQVGLVVAGGVLGDRLSRRSVLLAVNLVGAAVTGVVAAVALSGRLQAWELLAAAAAVGGLAAFVLPAYRPLCADVLRGEHLLPANALQDGAASATRIAGPALAGLLAEVFGLASGFVLNAASFAVAAASVLAAPGGRPAPDGPRQSPWRDALAGVRHVVGTRWLRSLIALSLAANVTSIAAFLVLLPVVVRERGLPVSAFGLIVLAQGAGTLAGNLLLGQVGLRVRRGAAFCAVVALTGTGAAGLALVPAPLGPGLAAGVFGLGMSAGVLEHTLLQEHVPGALLSRVYSLDMLGSIALLPLAYAVAGLLASAWGPSAVLVWAGALEVGLALLALSVSHLQRMA